jgi:hypothetical protein
MYGTPIDAWKNGKVATKNAVIKYSLGAAPKRWALLKLMAGQGATRRRRGS